MPEVTNLPSCPLAPTELAMLGVIVTAPLLGFTVKAVAFPLVIEVTTSLALMVTVPLLLSMAILSPAFKVTTFFVEPLIVCGVASAAVAVPFCVRNIHSSDFFATSVMVAVSLDTALFSPST